MTNLSAIKEKFNKWPLGARSVILVMGSVVSIFGVVCEHVISKGKKSILLVFGCFFECA